MIHNLVKYIVQTRFRLLENLLFLYLTNEVEFGQDFLQDYVSSYHLQYMGHVTYYLNYQYIRVRYFTLYLYQFVTMKQTVFESSCGKNRTGEMY